MDSLVGLPILMGQRPEESSCRHTLVADIVAAQKTFSVQDTHVIKPVVQHIRGLLSQPLLRLEGLSYLAQLVQQSSFSVFVDNYQNWFQDARQFIRNDAGKEHCILAVKIIGAIVEVGASHADILRWLGINIGQCVLQFLALSEQHDLSVAIGLSALMKHFPGPCKNSLSKIHKRVMRLLVSDDVRVVEAGSDLLARFAFSGQGGEGGKAHVLAWQELYEKVSGTLHATLNDLYNGLELEQYDLSNIKARLDFPIPFAGLDNVNSTSLFISNYRQAFALSKCLSSLLNVSTSLILTIPVESTLRLLCRLLKITGKTIMAKNVQDTQLILLYSVLPLLHIEALRFLETLIINCTSHLALHDATIQRLVLQTLQWTSSVRTKDDWRHSLGKLRQSAYNVASTWLSVSGGAIDFRVHGDAIVAHLLKDIALEESTVNLAQHQVKDTNTKKPPKAKKRRMDPNFASASSLGETNKPSIDPQTCAVALKTLRVLLFANADDLLAETHKDIHVTVSKVLVSIQCSPNTPRLYADPICRKALYALLHALLLNDPFLNASQLSTAIHLLSTGKLDSSSEVSLKCVEALAACRLMTQPPRRIFRSASAMVETVKVLQPMQFEEEEEEVEQHQLGRAHLFTTNTGGATVVPHIPPEPVEAVITPPLSNGHTDDQTFGDDIEMVDVPEVLDIGDDENSDTEDILDDQSSKTQTVVELATESSNSTPSPTPDKRAQVATEPTESSSEINILADVQSTSMIQIASATSLATDTEFANASKPSADHQGPKSNGIPTLADDQHAHCNGNSDATITLNLNAGEDAADVMDGGRPVASKLVTTPPITDEQTALDKMINCFVPDSPDENYLVVD